MTQKQLRIRSSFNKWSSGTVVFLVDHDRKRQVSTVKHLPTGEIFECPDNLLIEKRSRG